MSRASLERERQRERERERERFARDFFPRGTVEVSRTSVSYETSSKSEPRKSPERAFCARLPSKVSREVRVSFGFAPGFALLRFLLVCLRGFASLGCFWVGLRASMERGLGLHFFSSFGFCFRLHSFRVSCGWA